MAIQYITCASNGDPGQVTTTVLINVPSNPSTIMLIKAGRLSIGGASAAVTSVTVSGFAASFWHTHGCFNGTYPQAGKRGDWWYLCNPPTGLVSVVVTWPDNSAVAQTVIVEIFAGVNLSNPLEGKYMACGENGTSPSLTYASQLGWLPTDFAVMCTNGGAPVVGAAQLVTCLVDNDRGSPYDGWVGGSYEQGASTVTMSWTWTMNWLSLGSNLLPYSETVGRKADYFFDAWDPEQRIVDAMDRELQPWEVEPDHWMKITGLVLPTSETYESFDEDPEMAYTESTSWSESGDTVTIRLETNRGDMPDIILRRAAQGSVGG